VTSAVATLIHGSLYLAGKASVLNVKMLMRYEVLDPIYFTRYYPPFQRNKLPPTSELIHDGNHLPGCTTSVSS
jgi:hypothetical protein